MQKREATNPSISEGSVMYTGNVEDYAQATPHRRHHAIAPSLGVESRPQTTHETLQTIVKNTFIEAVDVVDHGLRRSASDSDVSKSSGEEKLQFWLPSLSSDSSSSTSGPKRDVLQLDRPRLDQWQSYVTGRRLEHLAGGFPPKASAFPSERQQYPPAPVFGRQCVGPRVVPSPSQPSDLGPERLRQEQQKEQLCVQLAQQHARETQGSELPYPGSAQACGRDPVGLSTETARYVSAALNSQGDDMPYRSKAISAVQPPRNLGLRLQETLGALSGPPNGYVVAAERMQRPALGHAKASTRPHAGQKRRSM